ncbi:hypothetical protein Tco_1019832 [Tanacetum coccineum]|uniref:Reverse transcriptase domain-containing protein n=1 Tax=Tanacetum coccineum TaxID=301880 RepID=A0ABQ5G068_9ASTR
MIDQALQRNSTNTHDDGSQNSGRGLGRPVQPARVCSYTDFMKCQPLNFKGIEGVVGLSRWFKKMESIFHISGCAIDNQVKGNDVGGYTHRFQELALIPKTLDDAIELANDLMDQNLRTYAERQAENKRKLDNNNQAQQQLLTPIPLVILPFNSDFEHPPHTGKTPTSSCDPSYLVKPKLEPS